MLSRRIALLALPLAATAVMIGPTADLHIVNGVVAPDGFSRNAVLANGLLPGPTLKATKGQTYNLNVIDQLTDASMLKSTSIHWHGFFQNNGWSWADGPSFVTQCPITTNHSFLYSFPTGDQAGTFWYHSHLRRQYCDGLRGVMVVYDPLDPHRLLYDVDDDTTIISLVDWYHDPAPALAIPPTLVSTLINGLGRYAGGPTSQLAVITVTRNVRYRFRLASLSCDPNWVFSIDNHTMTIIEVDSVNHLAHTVDSIQIFAGQRYSFVLNANQPVNNYWIRAQPNAGTLGFANGINSAILRYVGAPVADPATPVVPSTAALVEQDLHPLNPLALVPGLPFPGGADIKLNLQIALDFTTFQFTVNGATFTPPTAPVLLQILSGALTATDLLPPGSVYVLPPNKVVEVSIPGGSIGAPHPIHLHGHNFHVIRSAGSSAYNFLNPPIRDVVSTGPDLTDNVTFRFVTDNAGPWFLHCHIDFHLDIGLAVVFAEDTPHVTASQPPAWNALCPAYDALAPGDQ
ncbi:Laccase 3 [Mycena indigotica]|uniref:laccase n=1 Tax=Mycena indigotica TaxID=2126181 RepID=A0A8H6SRD2_9AGAR|nr:Laccase 3 [Mycena indigotica]KAF7303502.1 Laccase 3 [Mycena indigotica]